VTVAAVARAAVAFALLAVVGAGVAARLADLPLYVADSGDEWGNTLAPLRILYAGGDPGTFLHPSLFYDVTAAAYAAVYGALRLAGRIDGATGVADLLVLDQRWLVFTARAVSLLSGALAMLALWALGRALWNPLSGLAAAALLAVLPLHAVYSQTVRVDSLFLAVFLAALLATVRLLQGRGRADTAAVLTGLAIAANYNGGILLPWLGAALWWQPGARDPRQWWRAALLVGAAFLVACPFALLNAPAFLLHLRFIAGLSSLEHVGMEGRGPLFYVRELAHTLPVLTGGIAAAGITMALLGNRAERFVLALAVTYLAVFSLLATKFDRFILPALALFLLLVAGVPSLLARWLARYRWTRAAAVGVGATLVAACLATSWPRAIPVPRHEMLAPSEPLVLDWIAGNAPPRSTIFVESGVVPLLDGVSAPDQLGPVLREALVRVRPGLDHELVHASYVGHIVNYGPTVLADRGVDFAIVSRRNLQSMERQCAAFPDVCAVYDQLRRRGRVAFEAPPGTEPTIVFDLRPEPQGNTETLRKGA
jgi:4-amino-4-deoxy-L-arabinose transferase-like glycosyltransferase